MNCQPQTVGRASLGSRVIIQRDAVATSLRRARDGARRYDDEGRGLDKNPRELSGGGFGLPDPMAHEAAAPLRPSRTGLQPYPAGHIQMSSLMRDLGRPRRGGR